LYLEAGFGIGAGGGLTEETPIGFNKSGLAAANHAIENSLPTYLGSAVGLGSGLDHKYMSMEYKGNHCGQ